MPITHDADFEERLVSETSAYLDRIEACVGELPTLLDRYADEGPYRDAVDRVRELETECDRTNRRISALVANASAQDLGIRLTRVHLNSGATIELYQTLDGVANTVERFAEEIAAIEPPRSSALLDRLREMAELAVTAVTHLRRAVDGYVRTLCHHDRSATVAEEIGRIREIESDCDGVRNALVAAAFEDETGTTPLLYRELASLMDLVLDTIEDVTDRMIHITGNRTWIDVEPERSADVELERSG